MPALTKADRDALPDDAFAVPGRRLHPIHDADHVRMAWGEISAGSTKLSDDERAGARIRIMAAAADVGVDPAAFHKIKGMSLQAMSLDVPAVEDHPNRHPFSGILVRLDEPSDLAPHGSGGRKVTILRAAAEKAIPSLLGMGVDLTRDLDGHDAQKKVGVIMEASIVDEAAGPAVAIGGFFYASDFPDETASIRASADKLGFSFEARNIYVADPKADVLEITELAFTGAAVLFKDKAAYHRTSLAASAAQDIDMTVEEMKALLDAALAPMKTEIEGMKASAQTAAAEQAKLAEKIQASRAVLDKVEPHAAALEAAASKMEAEGIGAADRSGHAAQLRLMASSMRSEAALGKVPSTFYGLYAAGEKAPEGVPSPATDDVAAKVDAAVKAALAPVQAAAEKSASDLAAATQKISDLQAAAQAAKAPAAGAGERRSLPAAITNLLASASVALPDGDGQLAVKDIDAAFTKAGLAPQQRMQAKAALSQAGLLA